MAADIWRAFGFAIRFGWRKLVLKCYSTDRTLIRQLEIVADLLGSARIEDLKQASGLFNVGLRFIKTGLREGRTAYYPEYVVAKFSIRADKPLEMSDRFIPRLVQPSQTIA